jgi:transcription elongation factor Elf1
MALKFDCPYCGVGITVKFLSPGEAAKCRNCGAEVEVPADAQANVEEPGYAKSKAEDEEKRDLAKAEAAEKAADTSAVASFIIGIVGYVSFILPLIPFIWPLVAIVGVFLGFKGLKSKKKPYAIAGLILSSVWLLLVATIAVIIFVLYKAGELGS